jgi:hypothetical protein
VGIGALDGSEAPVLLFRLIDEAPDPESVKGAVIPAGIAVPGERVTAGGVMSTTPVPDKLVPKSSPLPTDITQSSANTLTRAFPPISWTVKPSGTSFWASSASTRT